MNLQIPQGSKVVELGGGANPMLAPRCLGGECINVDVREAKLPDGRRAVDIVASFEEPLPLTMGEFDHVLSRFCIEHVSFPKTKQFIAEIFRILKPGGRATIIGPNTQAQIKWIEKNPDGWDGKDFFTAASEKLFGSQDYPDNSHKSFWNPDVAVELFSQAGFQDILTAPFGGRGTDLMIEARKPPEDKAQETPANPQKVAQDATKEEKRPLPRIPEFDTAEGRQSIFSKKYFDGGHPKHGWCGYGDGYRDYPCHEATLQHVLLRQPKSVLELGCGRGYVVKRLQDAGVPAMGVDISRHCFLTRVCEDIICRDVCETPWDFLKDGEIDLCCRPDTLVHTKAGLQKISKIKVGDEVLTHRGRYRKVTKTYQRSYAGQLIRLRPTNFGNLPVYVTPMHPVLAVQTTHKEQRWSGQRHLLPAENFIEARKLSEKDVLAFAFPTEVKDVEWIDMREIPQPEAYVKYQQVLSAYEQGKSPYAMQTETGVPPRRSYSWINKEKWPLNCWFIRDGLWFTSSHDLKGFPIKTVVDKGFCRFVGYFLSDGCASGGHVTFVFGKEEQRFADDVEAIVERLWGLKGRRSRENCIKLEFDSKALVKLIRHFITAEKTRKKSIPQWMLVLPSDKQEQILRGLLRGDGSVDERNNYKLATSSLRMVSSVQLLCLRLGIVASIRVQSEGGKCRFKGHEAYASRGYSVFIKNVAGKLDGTKERRKATDGNRTFQYGWIDGCTTFLPIRSLDKIDYSGLVYNLEVEEDNSYTTSACTVHNCTSVAFWEHVPEEMVPAVAAEMRRVCKRGLHGIDLSGGSDDPSKATLKPRAWWKDMLGDGHEVVEKNQLEHGGLPPAVLQGDGKVKWNLCSFTTMFHHGWVNCDVHDLGPFADGNKYVYKKIDVREGLPLMTGTADFFMIHHGLEHFTPDEALTLCREMRRCVKPDGGLRIVVPDAEVLSRLYAEKRLGEFDELNDGVERAETQGAKFWQLLGEGHKASYDPETLCALLETAGWEPHVQSFRQSMFPQILRETTEHEYGGYSLFVDAKPKLD